MRFTAPAGLGSPETRPPRLGRRKGRLGALGNGFSLMFGHRRQNVQRQLVRMRVIDRNELDTGVHERCDKGQVSRQPIQLGNDQLGLLLSAGINGFSQFRTVRAFPGFDLGIFPN